MKIAVKKWWYKNQQLKAMKYNFTLCWDKKYASVDFSKMTENEIKEFYKNFEINKEKYHIGYYVYGNKVNETEKAVKLELSYYNLYLRDCQISTKKWSCWIPKSALL